MIFGLILIKLIVLLLFGLFFGINVKDKGFFCFLIFNVKDLFGLFWISIIKVIYCVKGWLLILMILLFVCKFVLFVVEFGCIFFSIGLICGLWGWIFSEDIGFFLLGLNV